MVDYAERLQIFFWLSIDCRGEWLFAPERSRTKSRSQGDLPVAPTTYIQMNRPCRSVKNVKMQAITPNENETFLLGHWILIIGYWILIRTAPSDAPFFRAQSLKMRCILISGLTFVIFLNENPMHPSLIAVQYFKSEVAVFQFLPCFGNRCKLRQEESANRFIIFIFRQVGVE